MMALSVIAMLSGQTFVQHFVMLQYPMPFSVLRRRVEEEPGPDELIEQLMVAQHVADVLAEKALDALAEFLHAFDVGLKHAPRAVRRIGRPRRKRLDAQ